jgi:protoporphyrinogen oxidase
VVSTIPLPEFILGIEPKLNERYLALAKDMKFRGIKFLHLILDAEFITDNTWIYVPEAKYFFFRIQDRRNWSPTTVPNGKNALTLEIACNKNDEVWNMPDEKVFERCIKDLEDLKLVKRNKVLDYFTENIEHAYPIYTLDYQDKIRTMYNFLSKIKDFIPIGRQGLYRYNNMDHSLKMGILAAMHILHGYPRQKILDIATENIIFDWQDPGYHDGMHRIIE